MINGEKSQTGAAVPSMRGHCGRGLRKLHVRESICFTRHLEGNLALISRVNSLVADANSLSHYATHTFDNNQVKYRGILLAYIMLHTGPPAEQLHILSQHGTELHIRRSLTNAWHCGSEKRAYNGIMLVGPREADHATITASQVAGGGEGMSQ